MGRSSDPEPYREPPEAGIGGEGPITDLTVLAPTTDDEIAEAVRIALLLDPDVDPDLFTIEVNNGVVHLKSELCSESERQRAVEVARRVANVRRVIADP